MGKKTENNEGAVEKNGFKIPKAFRIAYSLNNHQPVECTIISDQPLFYMDDEIPYEDDAILSDDMFEEDEYDFTGQSYRPKPVCPRLAIPDY